MHDKICGKLSSLDLLYYFFQIKHKDLDFHVRVRAYKKRVIGKQPLPIVIVDFLDDH